MFEGYGVYGVQELWNNWRTYHYATVAGLKDPGFIITGSPCDRVPLIVNSPPGNIYTDPVVDSAPWYDAEYPESGEVAGLWVTDVTDFSNLGSRNVTPTPFGSVASRRNLDPKTLTVTGWIVGKTCCATQYYYRWLLKRLMERDCLTGIETSQLSMYDCCPDEDESVGFTDQQLIDKYLRAMYGVKIAKDPTVIQKLGVCCGSGCGSTSIQVQFTLLLENPKLYKNIELCAEEQDWGETINCVTFGDCDTCDVEDTVEVDVIRQKTRYPVAVNADGSWCPIGWEVDTADFPPENGWLDVSEVETQQKPVQVTVSYDGTWTALDWNPTFVDLCDVEIQIAMLCSDTGVDSELAEECTDGGAEPRDLPIMLTTTSPTGGTWSPQGWYYDDSDPLPPNFSNLVIQTDCGCDTDTTEEATIILNSDLTWEGSDFTYIGVLPPLGSPGLRVRQQSPGTYTSIEEVPISEAFSPMRGLVPPEPYISLAPTYCQPLEWVQYCCQIDFTSGVERAEPYLEFFSGSDPLYNFKAEFYPLESAEDVCLCDIDPEDSGALDDWLCREPSYAVQFGRSIPANTTIVYDPRDQSIRAHYAGTSQDASSLASGYNGGNPYFVELPDCYGVCVLLTAEAHEGSAPAADSYISVGHIPFTYVGV